MDTIYGRNLFTKEDESSSPATCAQIPLNYVLLEIEKIGRQVRPIASFIGSQPFIIARFSSTLLIVNTPIRERRTS